MSPGYRALREGAAWLDLSGRGIIRVTGEDRVRLLHAMTTNDVEHLQTGQWCYAFFLTAQGRILADTNILRRDSDCLLDTEPETRELVLSHLDKFIIADDVTLEDLSGTTAVIALEGPRAAPVALAAGLEAPWTMSATGAPAVRFFVPLEEKAALLTRLETAGAVAASATNAHVVRLEHARPRYGEDVSANSIPHEVRLLGAVHYRKGCYLGQEIVERVRSRGHPNRLLTHFAAAGRPPERGAKVTVDGAEVGEVTSSAYSPAHGKSFFLAMVRATHAAPGAVVECGGVPAEATGLLRETTAVG